MHAERLSVEIWGTLVWLAAGSIALALPWLVSMPMSAPAPALFETVCGLPLAVWLALMVARALFREAWTVLGGRQVALADQPSAFWTFTGIVVLLSGVFLAGFVRGLISLVALG